MVLKYAITLSPGMITREMETYVQWHNRLMRAILFPTENVKVEVVPPSSLMDWCQQDDVKKLLSTETLSTIYQAYSDLRENAQQVVLHLAEGQKITPQIYDRLHYFFSLYMTQLKILEKDFFNTGTALDPVTGFRSGTGVRTDIMQELERRDRNGLPFSVCGIRVDRMEEIRQHYDINVQNAIFSEVANILSSAVRSFDDAYHLGNGEFLLCLKQADLLDSCTVMDRYHDIIHRHLITLPDGLGQMRVTVSCGVVEPIPGDSIDEVLNNVQSAIGEAEDAGGNKVSQYHESSKLQKFVRENID